MNPVSAKLSSPGSAGVWLVAKRSWGDARRKLLWPLVRRALDGAADLFFARPLLDEGLLDLILSSGFLAFARHLGVLEAIRARGIETEALVGTSSGALVGALAQAGMRLADIGELLGGEPPFRSLALNKRPWRGLFSTSKAVRILSRHLPERFEELPKLLAVGVCDDQGRHHLIHRGELLPALLASMAIPRMFPSVQIDGRTYVDGGVVDRAGVDAWRRWRPDQEAIVHIVERSRGRDVSFDAAGTLVIRTPRSHARFWSLGDFAGQRREACELAHTALDRRPAILHGETAGAASTPTV